LFLINNNYAFFDEDIVLYSEETDLQFQLMKIEKKVAYRWSSNSPL